MLAAQTQSLVGQLGHAGVTLSLTATGSLAVSPASLLTDDLRELIRAGKSELIGWARAANAPLPLPTMPVTHIGTIRPPGLSPKMLAASLALDASIAAAGPNSVPETDRHCFPYSAAMTGAEIDTFTALLHRFTTKGVIQLDSEWLADKLVQRDRDSGDRGLCLECIHLGGYGASSWRCDNWQRAGIAGRARDAQLPADLVCQLQRCDGLTHHLKPHHESVVMTPSHTDTTLPTPRRLDYQLRRKRIDCN